jgi:hypothetical protein
LGSRRIDTACHTASARELVDFSWTGYRWHLRSGLHGKWGRASALLTAASGKRTTG